MSDAKTYYEQNAQRMVAAKTLAPDAVKGFGSLFAATMKAGELSVMEKELIALSIGMAVRCDNCIYAHVMKALDAGATPGQVMEAAGVAVMMQGGPTYTYLPKVTEALETLKPAEA